MNVRRIMTSLSMILRMLFRRRIVLILLVVIPIVFFSVVAITTSIQKVPFRIASMNGKVFILASEKHMALVFFAVAIAGFLMSFLAMNLIQKNSTINRRLMVCGYHPLELLLSNLLALTLMILMISVYVGLLTAAFFHVSHPGMMIFSLALTGFVYGGYGLAVGSLIAGELEGILFIVLLANIDAGWLQNPIFYAEAQNQALIHYLPAFYPSQAAIIAAFTDYSGLNASLNSLWYGLGFLAFSMLIFVIKMRIRK